jgi:hypothetical protein
MKISAAQKKELIVEMRKIYEICTESGYTPSGSFVALGQQLKAETSASGDEAEELYQDQTMKQVEEWLEAVETNVENEGSGGTVYRDNEKMFIEDMRSRVCERSTYTKPLTGKQLRWLKQLYDKS